MAPPVPVLPFALRVNALPEEDVEQDHRLRRDYYPAIEDLDTEASAILADSWDLSVTARLPHPSGKAPPDM